MAFYIHLGCELNGGSESINTLDRWIHMVALSARLNIMAIVMEL